MTDTPQSQPSPSGDTSAESAGEPPPAASGPHEAAPIPAAGDAASAGVPVPPPVAGAAPGVFDQPARPGGPPPETGQYTPPGTGQYTQPETSQYTPSGTDEYTPSGPETTDQPTYGAPPPGGDPYGDPYSATPPPDQGGPHYGPPATGWAEPTGPAPSDHGRPAASYGQAPPTPPAGNAAAPPPIERLEVAGAIGYGWTRFRANPIPWIAVTLVGFVAYLAVTVVINVADVTSVLPVLLIFLAVSVVVWLLQAAMIRGALYETDGTPPDFQSYFGFVNAGNVLITAVLVFVAAWIGALLCVFPALIVGFLCMFALHFVIDRDQDPFSAIKSSVALVLTNIVPALLLALTVVAMTVLSTVLCGIPLLIVGPVSALSITYAYRVLVGGLVVP